MSKIYQLFLASLILLIVAMVPQQSASVWGSLLQQDTNTLIFLPLITHNDPDGTPDPIVDPDLVFLETFDGDPASPEAWTDEHWDLTIHQRDQDRLYEMYEMPAHHGPNCEPPPATPPYYRI